MDDIDTALAAIADLAGSLHNLSLEVQTQDTAIALLQQRATSAENRLTLVEKNWE